MSPQAFCYWLSGLLESGNPKTLNAKQVKCIKQHLALLLKNESKFMPKAEVEKLLRDASRHVWGESQLIC